MRGKGTRGNYIHSKVLASLPIAVFRSRAGPTDRHKCLVPAPGTASLQTQNCVFQILPLLTRPFPVISFLLISSYLRKVSDKLL